jgi:phosphoglycerate dehydrogenase-like enzyme
VIRVLSEVALTDAAAERVRGIPGVSLEMLPPHARGWELEEEWLRGVEVFLCKWPPSNLLSMTDLKWLQLTSVGYEHLKDFDLAGRPLKVCNARGIFDMAIAEWSIAMMINLVRDVRGMIRNQEKGHWERPQRFQEEVRGRVVGLWGYGGIGRETARLGKALGMTVHVLVRHGVGPRPNVYVVPGTGDPDGSLPDKIFLAGQEREFLSGLDFLILALPRTKVSDGMVGEEQLRMLPRTACILNPARGPIIQEAALLRALREGWIQGAAIDTHFAYPLPPEHPLWQFPNVIVTPHIAGADLGSAYPARVADLFIANLERYVHGQPLFNEITVAEWREV